MLPRSRSTLPSETRVEQGGAAPPARRPAPIRNGPVTLAWQFESARPLASLGKREVGLTDDPRRLHHLRKIR